MNELDSPEHALKELKRTDSAVDRHDYGMTDSQKRMRKILGDLFDQYELGDKDSTGMAKSDRDFLEDRLGWVGALALTPPDSPNTLERKSLERIAQRSFFILIGGCLFGGFLLLAGMFGIMAFLFIIGRGKVSSRMADTTGYGGIYAETFAIWMLMFVGLQLGLQLFSRQLEPAIVQLLTPTAFFASLSVLIWPVLRGVSVNAMRHDIGLTIGNPFKESGAGLLSYVSLLPVLMLAGLAAILIAMLMSLAHEQTEFGGGGAAGHPIQEEIASGDPTTWLFVS